jgi:hypothetical protein
MPTKNFFLLSSLTPTYSFYYPFLYFICKHPKQPTSMLLNCQPQNSHPRMTSTFLNCNLAQTSHDMPSGHVGHLGHLRHFEHWMYCGIPNSPYIILRHLRQLRHLSHLSHLSHLGNIGNLNPFDPSPLDPVLTDSLLGAFIIEMDPIDPGPSEGCYANDLLDPLHIRTLETAYTCHHRCSEPLDYSDCYTKSSAIEMR